MTVAVHGPIPLIRQSNVTASGLGSASSVASSSLPVSRASATLRSVANLFALTPAALSTTSFAPCKLSIVGNMCTFNAPLDLHSERLDKTSRDRAGRDKTYLLKHDRIAAGLP